MRVASAADAMAASATNAARSSGMIDRFSFLTDTFLARPLPRAPLYRSLAGLRISARWSDCCVRSACLANKSFASADQQRPGRTVRRSARSKPAARSARGRLSERGARQPIVHSVRVRDARRAGASEDVAAAIGEDGYNYRYVGLVVSYGQNLDNAIGVALGTTANGPALFESAMSQAGIASAPIEEGAAPWIAPPPGGVGRAIELTGLTVVVIVTAGEFRAVT
ncbi:MAG: hypothetical protein R2849_10555 [Thermomicrobiales bacterium]